MNDAAVASTATFLGDLYAEQLGLADDPYLRPRARSAVLRRYAEAFELYRTALRPGRLLDWGCRHGATGCLAKRELGDEVEVHGCDMEELRFETFYRYAELEFVKLNHPFVLPYPDGHFETVVGNGVLEHVSHPRGSLTEIHRVLAPGGTLIITFLPNLFSYTEIASAALGRTHHERRYTRGRIRDQLREAGFDVVKDGFHQLIPTLVSQRDGRAARLGRAADRLYALNPWLERVPLLNRVAANIYAIARKPAT